LNHFQAVFDLSKAVGGVSRPEPGQLLDVFDFPEKFTEVKACHDDVVSRTGRSNTY
jgi:hypothetical protein